MYENCMDVVIYFVWRNWHLKEEVVARKTCVKTGISEDFRRKIKYSHNKSRYDAEISLLLIRRVLKLSFFIQYNQSVHNNIILKI